MFFVSLKKYLSYSDETWECCGRFSFAIATIFSKLLKILLWLII